MIRYPRLFAFALLLILLLAWEWAVSAFKFSPLVLPALSRRAGDNGIF